MMLGTVYNKPVDAGFASLFIKKDSDVNNPEVVIDQVDEMMSNSILDSSKELDVVYNGPLPPAPLYLLSKTLVVITSLKI